ncbi:MAG: class IV adenylate cyclase [Methanosarcina sp.]|uniref:class IV adenylate cyclase n=1 Tax=Methanosarcina sp. TaxID=2213 RepID=UPI0026135CA7|nr:class IV adenylate cyclase [Methanosarcina sp.]MDD3246775.1 class IV adenylate cyclase [Methanosarcina sp.]MDD4248262.1 class IV adenylate cyclase [Methanosarcina sp.]
MIEVEVKVRADHSKVRSVLQKLGAIKIGIENQSDTYFAAPYRDFSKTDEALRIRSLDGQAVLTYKGPKLDKVSKTREELETSVDEATTAKILHALGFSDAGIVRKKREVFRAGEITVCLDAVEGLGEFLEVEIIAEDEKDLETSRGKLFELLKQFGAGEKDSIRTSYLEMVLDKSN